jgi:hypothetical protein
MENEPKYSLNAFLLKEEEQITGKEGKNSTL